MGLLDRFRGASSAEESWRPPLPGVCQCSEHVDAIADLVIEADPPAVVKELVDQVTVEPSEEQYLFGTATGQRRGPFEWRLSYTPAVARLYDADAPAHIDDMLYIQDGIDNLLRLGDDLIAIGAAGRCDQGVAAALFRALANPRVRRPV